MENVKISVTVAINGHFWTRREEGFCDVRHPAEVIRHRVIEATKRLMNDISDTTLQKAKERQED